MTDLTEHDRKIVAAAEKMTASWCMSGVPPVVLAVFYAVAAKREAARPKLMTPEEANEIFSTTPTRSCRDFSDMQAVLDAAHARALKVIEALPDWEFSAHRGSPSSNELRKSIRAALGVKP